jgi:multiple sugar transport system substrate-binding protein
MFKDILHAPLPKGAGGQFNLPGPFTSMLMGYSKNQKPAKDFLRWVSSKPIFEQWFTSQQGYTVGATLVWEEDKVWTLDPVLLPFRDLPRKGRLMGYAGQPNRASAEAQTKYIIVDMYAKAVQGTPAEDAVKGAHEELVKIYA